ncbi:Ubiquitin system component Cue protein [Zostera marina]|uniref:Ubiquitin system component Cue protein n=1 Tax=Zostera marina TaxID=29655 RepID=A0A0K9Q1J3_ZOSMR|nr:Ubiquitin system component Cue protein [Zostera marina]
MSAGICGKRLGLEEVFGSPSSSAPKRFRFSSTSPPSSFHGSVDRFSTADLVADRADKVLALLRIFPSMDRKVVEKILDSHDHNIDDAIRSLHALCLNDPSLRNDADILNQYPVQATVNMHMTGQKNEDSSSNPLGSEATMSAPSVDGTSWVDVFVQEMMKASDWDDVKGRATKILEAFEGNVVGKCKETWEQESVSLQEQLQSLLRENQILKRAVAIQHERSVEYEEKLKEADQLKHMIGQYQQQVQTLELNNYSLKIHLQKAQDTSSIPSQFHPDIF